jgi:NAD(P)-dependent dehydrogenase (short-subunit alcohol dehydrogenase family)
MTEVPVKTVLVTGGAKRIGAAISNDLAAHGWAVAVHYNTSGDEARELVGGITEDGGRAVAVQADLRREDEAAGLMSLAARELGPVSCLVNNASIFEKDTPETATKDSWDAHMQVNLRAPFVLTQAFAAGLPDDLEGNVINMIDQRVWNLTPSFTSYTVSKAGLWALTRSLALALAPNIRINAIGPGPTLPSTRQTDQDFILQWTALPLGRNIMPEEICDAVRFIINAPAMTGQMIALDGGQHLGWRAGD